MPWPTPQDYNEAIQNPNLNFADAELREGVLELTPMGLPRVASGAFASVYRMQTDRRSVAVRCFLQNIPDQHRRYEAISRFVSHDQLMATVDFEYIEKGIRVQGAWYPILKMEWAPGRSLDEFVRKNLDNTEALRKLLHSFKDMLRDMRRDGIAHGDLQHGNILVMDDCSIRLVDYDGMYVPELSGLESHELGHRNYQHPQRSKEHYGPYLDNFAAWSIFTSLFALKRDASLLTALKGGDECLLFRTFDYRNPTKSKVFGTMEEHADEDIRNIARAFRSMLYRKPQDVPYLEDEFHVPADLPPLQIRSRATASSALPDWMIDGANEIDAGVDGVDVRDYLDYGQSAPVQASVDDPWPTLQQYMTAMSMPAASFFDEELQLARVPRDTGKIVPLKHGENAVFRMHKSAKVLAVKVFLHPDQDRDARYEAISKFLGTPEAYHTGLLKFIPRFDYQKRGIRIGTKIYPLVKMEWIEGKSLDVFCAESASEGMLESIRHQFRSLMKAMREAQVVHGELEPENIIISPEGLKLIDFDAMVIARHEFMRGSWRGLSRGKLRHPKEDRYVDLFSDIFPSWLIDSALSCLRENPGLRFNVPHGHFMFETADFYQSSNTETLTVMEESTDEVLMNRARLIAVLADMERDLLPALNMEAALSKEFCKKYLLDFGELRPGMLSPDVRKSIRSNLLLTASSADNKSNLPATDHSELAVQVGTARAVLLLVMVFCVFSSAWGGCLLALMMFALADAVARIKSD